MDEKKYECLQSLLLYFMYYTVESYNHLKDEEVIKLYIDEVSKIEVESSIEQAKAIIQEDPFPEEWIDETSMSGPQLSKEDLEKRNKGLPYYEPTVKEWIEWMIIELEKGYAAKYGDER